MVEVSRLRSNALETQKALRVFENKASLLTLGQNQNLQYL